MLMHDFAFGTLGMLGVLLMFAMGGLVASLAITAYVHDAMARRWVWLVSECVVPPIAIVRGLLIWFDTPVSNGNRRRG